MSDNTNDLKARNGAPSAWHLMSPMSAVNIKIAFISKAGPGELICKSDGY